MPNTTFDAIIAAQPWLEAAFVDSEPGPSSEEGEFRETTLGVVYYHECGHYSLIPAGGEIACAMCRLYGL